MNEENKKLLNVQRSCKGAKIVSKIIVIALIVATVLSLVSSIVLIAGRKKYDQQMINSAQEGHGFKTQIKFGSIVVADIVDGEVQLKDTMDSDVPAVQEFFDENADSPSLLIGLYLILISVMLAFVSVAFTLISSVFDIILKEGNPFTDKAINRTLLAMIIICILLASTSGIGFGILGGFLTWVVYTIMDYGRVLKIQADETL